MILFILHGNLYAVQNLQFALDQISKFANWNLTTRTCMYKQTEMFLPKNVTIKKRKYKKMLFNTN